MKNSEQSEQVNLVEILDAFCDLQYVLSGAILEFGMKNIFDEAFKEVHSSNMSKACKTKQEVVDTIAKYQSRFPDLSVKFELGENGAYLCYRVSDNKTIKSINYRPADLTRFIELSN